MYHSCILLYVTLTLLIEIMSGLQHDTDTCDYYSINLFSQTISGVDMPVSVSVLYRIRCMCQCFIDNTS